MNIIKNLKTTIAVLFFGLFAVQLVAQNHIVTVKNTSESFHSSLISSYQEGASIVQEGTKYGFVNEQGQEICSAIYDEVRLFNQGYAAVKKHGKWTFINKLGRKLTSPRYDWVACFENGLAAVLYNGKWGVLNEQGFEVVPTEYDAIKKDEFGNLLAQQGSQNWKVIYAVPL